MLPLSKEFRFASQAEMNGFFCRRFGAESPEQQGVVKTYLAPLVREDANGIVIAGNSTFAKVWWKKKNA